MFWYAYVEILQTYHQFIRNIRDGDFNLYICTLQKIRFFVLNRQNYARWLPVYQTKLLNLKKQTHPQMYQDCKNSWFALKRTFKKFFLLSIDLTLKRRLMQIQSVSEAAVSVL